MQRFDFKVSAKFGKVVCKLQMFVNVIGKGVYSIGVLLPVHAFTHTLKNMSVHAFGVALQNFGAGGLYDCTVWRLSFAWAAALAPSIPSLPTILSSGGLWVLVALLVPSGRWLLSHSSQGTSSLEP